MICLMNYLCYSRFYSSDLISVRYFLIFLILYWILSL
jgi:hypothetical protein